MDHADSPYRCTLTTDEAAGRIDADRALAARVTGTDRLDRGLRVWLAPGEDSRRLAETFVANERRCCSFFAFAVETTADGVVLEITAPPDETAQQLVDDARRAFQADPDELAPLAGLEADRG